VALIGDYLASRLSSRVLNAFEKHLKDCSDCASFYEPTKKTMEVTRSFLSWSPRNAGASPRLSAAGQRPFQLLKFPRTLFKFSIL
jgi:hypothetical protein